MGLLQNRFVNPRPRGAEPFTEGSAPQDGPLARIVKYVPTEVIAIYTAATGALTGANAPLISIVILGLVAVGAISAVTWRSAPDPNVRIAHLIVSNAAFLAWAYPISSPLLGDLFVGWVSAVAQAVVLLLALAIVPQKAA